MSTPAGDVELEIPKLSKSAVSRSCSELDRDLKAFRERPLEHVEIPYVFLDAAYVKVRARGREVSRAVV